MEEKSKTVTNKWFSAISASELEPIALPDTQAAIAAKADHDVVLLHWHVHCA